MTHKPTIQPLAAAVLAALATAAHAQQAADAPAVLKEVSVTGTREGALLVETPASVGIVKPETMRQDKPTHPAQIISQVPGAAVAVTNGEGHTTAIRQPFTTSPVYQFLEDGIPVRSTGFFNHNALYEINIPQAGGIEINRGPGTALYGSDAIGGVINVLTRTPPAKPEIGGSLEFGQYGWKRLLAGGGTAAGDNAWRADLNLTHTDGWRDKTAYDRQSGTLRWDRALGGNAVLKTVLAFSRIDQETGANSPLVRADYENSPRSNYLPIAFRKVDALRLSASYERETADSLLTVTPYLRDNSMDLLASFTLRSDPTVSTTRNRSYGLLAKWRQDFAPQRARIIGGVDIDVSPGGREENRLNATTSGSGATQQFLAYTVGPRVYDYDVTFRGVSPYVHGEISPLDRLRLSAGLRYDRLGYRFDNRLDSAVAAGGRVYGQAPDTTLTFSRTTPKLGATWAVNGTTHLFASVNQGFRVPSESQLFRPSNGATVAAANALAQSALDLKPIRATQLELGVRGTAAGVAYDVAVFDLTKRDDIVSVRDTATNFTQTVNAGKTRHRGVEVGLGVPLAAALRVDAALSYAKHEYVDWLTASGDFSGKEMESAPRVMGNVRATWNPVADARVQLEWVRLGGYWMDQANSVKYEGHNLFNLRANWPLVKGLSLFGSVYNLADKRYAESASISSSTPMYAPGMPRTVTLGVEARW